MQTHPVFVFSTKSAVNQRDPTSYLYLTLYGPGLVSMIFVVVKFEITTTARESSPQSSELEAEAVTGARGCSEDSAIEGGASSERRVSGIFLIGAVHSQLGRVLQTRDEGVVLSELYNGCGGF